MTPEDENKKVKNTATIVFSMIAIAPFIGAGIAASDSFATFCLSAIAFIFAILFLYVIVQIFIGNFYFYKAIYRYVTRK